MQKQIPNIQDKDFYQSTMLLSIKAFVQSKAEKEAKNSNKNTAIPVSV